ncbi:DDB1- and CUL4-associated factor 8-like isoform X2 [Chenopodium quinoa]|uniref:Uncharacterized protein n=1 Tax=Chenopodium quinoa TaxID=63459 RepID=A0A803LG94_CHEQI|nr:DDB1- and CUL4-associated factor 8-like isoform X2 [Chenopodium quinoa]
MGVKRPRSVHDKAILDVWRREVGQLSSRSFAHRLTASEDFVLRLDILRKLEKHRGCVNTVSFNASGEILVSGSDDRRVILWDWEVGKAKLSFHSGHNNNVFQAKFMPFSEDGSIVTCAADGQVRHAQILEGGRVETSLLGRHQGRAHKLAIEPGSPHIFYTCGEDGIVQHFDLRTKASTELFTCHSNTKWGSDFTIVQLNTIAIDPRSPNLFAVGGSDEYTRIYDIRRYKWDGSTDFDQPINFYCPEHLVGNAQVGITGLAYSDQSELLVSYDHEHIYLFAKNMGWGPNPPTAPSSSESTCSDIDEPGRNDSSEAVTSIMDTEKKPVPLVFKGHHNRDTVKGVGFFGPKNEYVVSGSDCGRIFIWRKKDGELIRVMEADKHVVNCIAAHPHTAVLASSGIESDIKIWTPKAEERATLPANIDELRPRQRDWMYHVTSPQELLLQLVSLENRLSRPEQSGNSGSGQDFMELILSLSRRNGDSSDDGGDDDSGPEDFFS